MKSSECVRELRKSLGLTMDAFGSRLGVSKQTISNIENGNREMTEHMFKSICREFDVNPDWLRDGSGPMFKEKSRNDEIAAFIDDILKNEPDGVKAHMVAALARLDDRDWARIAEIAQSLLDYQLSGKPIDEFQNGVIAPAANEQQAAADRQRDTEIKKLHAELDRQLDLEADTQKSPGSSAG